MLSFKQFIYESKKIDMGPEELKTAYDLRKQGELGINRIGDKMGYNGGSLHSYLDHPDTIKKAKENNIEYVPHSTPQQKSRKIELPERMVKQAYELRSRGITDAEMHRSSDYNFGKHFKDRQSFTKHLEDNKEKFPKQYTASPRKRESRPKDFEPTIYKKSLSGMSHHEIAGEHGITTGNVRAIVSRVSRQHKKTQGTPMEKDINENWVKTRQAVKERLNAKREEQSSALADKRDEHLRGVQETVADAMNKLHELYNNKNLHPHARDQAKKSLDAITKHFRDHY